MKENLVLNQIKKIVEIGHNLAEFGRIIVVKKCSDHTVAEVIFIF